MADLPDWYSFTETELAKITSINYGDDVDKPALPLTGQVYLATDTKILYVCNTDGTWESSAITEETARIVDVDAEETARIAADALRLLLTGGTMSGAIAMGNNKITGLAAPTVATGAARKAELDAVEAKLDDVSITVSTKAIDTEYQNSTKLRLVIISVRLDDGESVQFAMDSTSPPSTVYADGVSIGARTDLPISIIVPPSWYYELFTNTGSPSIVTWAEQDLL